jgi:multidrug resistance efflux pump
MPGSGSEKSKRKAKIYGVLLAAIVAMGSLIIVALTQEPKKAVSSPAPARAAIVPQIAESKSEAEITFRGKSFAPLQWRLAMKHHGEFLKILVEAGQTVKKGDTLIEYKLQRNELAKLKGALDTSRIRALEQSLYNQKIQLSKVIDVNLELAKIKLERSKKELEDVRRLHAKDMAAADLVDNQEKAVLANKKRIQEVHDTAKQLRSQIKKIKDDIQDAKEAHERKVGLYEWRSERPYLGPEGEKIPLEKAFVKAPENGVILWLSPTVREGAEFNSGLHAITMAKMDRIIVRCKVHELDLVKLDSGDRGVVSFDAIPERQYPCMVSRIPWVSRNPALEVPADYDIECRLDNVDNSIKEGLTCNVKISISQ